MITIASSKPQMNTQKSNWQRESTIKLDSWKNEPIRLNLIGGRILEGTLLSFDTTLNLVLDNCKELFISRKPSLLEGKDKESRELGIVFTRGTQLSSICLASGMEEISNPFVEE